MDILSLAFEIDPTTLAVLIILALLLDILEGYLILTNLGAIIRGPTF